MEIKIDYYLRKDGNVRIMHTTVTDSDIQEMLEKKFRDGDLACPIYYDRDTVEVEFSIDKVIV